MLAQGFFNVGLVRNVVVLSPLTSNPCFSEGTQTSLLAAQSAWLEAENTDVGELGPASIERKRVTSLAPPATDLAMAVSLKGGGGLGGNGKSEVRHICATSHNLSMNLKQAYTVF